MVLPLDGLDTRTGATGMRCSGRELAGWVTVIFRGATGRSAASHLGGGCPLTAPARWRKLNCCAPARGAGCCLVE